MRVHLDGKGLEMRQDALDGLVAPGAAPLGRQRLPEVLLKGVRQAGRPGQSLLRALLALQIAQKQAQVAVLHLWRRRPGRHRMLQILLDPPSEAILSPRAPRHQRPCILSWSVLGHAPPPFPRLFVPSLA